MFIKAVYGRQIATLINSDHIIDIKESKGELIIHTTDRSTYATNKVTLDEMQKILNERGVLTDPIEQYIIDHKTDKPSK